MEQLFKQSELESRLSLNMNVLDATGVPRVMGLGELLEAFLAHRMEVLTRRSRFRLRKIEERLEILEGYLKAFLDIDEVIRIIRESDEPKPELMAAFELSERQAEAVLNLRLRNLRKLEEMELKKEKRTLSAERKNLKTLLGDEDLRRERLAEEMRSAREQFADPRRTRLQEAPTIDPVLLEQPIERVPVTIVCSEKGWLRSPTWPPERSGGDQIQGRAMESASSSRRRARTSCWRLPMTEGSTRLPWTSCPPAGVMASP